MAWALLRLAIAIIELGDPELGTRIADGAHRVLGGAADTVGEEGSALGLFAAVAIKRPFASDGSRG